MIDDKFTTAAKLRAEARRLSAQGKTQKEIAQILGRSVTTINKYLNHDGPGDKYQKRNLEIIVHRIAGASQRDIAHLYRLTTERVRCICKRGAPKPDIARALHDKYDWDAHAIALALSLTVKQVKGYLQ